MANNNLLLDSCAVELSQAHPPLRAPCIPPGSGRAIALVGDSHATALAGGLRTIAEKSAYRLVELTKGACPELEGISVEAYSELGLSPECFSFNLEALDYIVKDPSIQVVVIAEYWPLLFATDAVRKGGSNMPLAIGRTKISQEQKWGYLAKGLENLVLRLQGSGKVVYLLQDNPNFRFDPVRLMRTRFIGPRRILATQLGNSSQGYTSDLAPDANDPNDLKARIIVGTIAAAHPTTHLLDLRRPLCSSQGCRFAEGDQVLYVDDAHLSLLGAQVALAELRLP